MKSVCISVCLFLNIFRAGAQQPEGLVSQNAGSAKGFVLFSHLNSKVTYLIDKCGKSVHTWTSKYKPAQSLYLLPDGSLLRTGDDSASKGIAAVGGKIERFDWDNHLLWTYSLANDTERLHHDICPLPNGHVLALVCCKKTEAEAVAMSRKPFNKEHYMLSEKIIEIKPIGRDSGLIVWQWEVWDHLIQDINPALPGYGVVLENPQLFNINFIPSPGPDWLHFNSVSYNAALDQVLVSIHEFGEVFIIDHSTTTAQAASHTGGKRGKGGDILYRWGNPAAYNAGNLFDQQLFRQHNAHWIEKGLKDEGKIMIFNNGTGRHGPAYSTLEVIEPPVDQKGNYVLEAGKKTGPAKPSWNYTAQDTSSFYSKNVSGAQRLPGGNTLICAGQIGNFFEIDAQKNIVWTFVNQAGLHLTNFEGVKRGEKTFRCTFYEPSYPAFKGRKIKACPPTIINPGAVHYFSQFRMFDGKSPAPRQE